MQQVDEQGKFFVSYARADSAVALKLAADLRAAGVNLWLDQLDIPAGARWDQAVESALRSASGILLLLSPASTASENVMDEVGLAMDTGKRILPVLIDACEIPLRIRRLQYVDFTGDYATAIKSLLDAVTLGVAAAPAVPASAQRRPVVRTGGKPRRRLAAFAGAVFILAGIGGLGAWWHYGHRANEPEWMTSEHYNEMFRIKEQEGYFPAKVEGRCEKGVEVYRAEWKAFPLGTEHFVALHGVEKAFYDDKSQEFAKLGLTLEFLNNFKDCQGNLKYQGVWFKRKSSVLPLKALVDIP